MGDDKPKAQLLHELKTLRQQVASLEQQIDLLHTDSDAAAFLTPERQQFDSSAVSADQRLVFLQQLISALASPLTAAEVFDCFLQHVLKRFGATYGWVAQPEATGVEIVRLVSAKSDLTSSDATTNLGQILPATEAIQTGEIVMVRSKSDYDRRYPQTAKLFAETGCQSLIALPLVSAGQIVAVVGWNFAQVEALEETDYSFFNTLAQQCVQTLERAYLCDAERLARETAEATNRVRDEFLALLSHELRSPLNPILGWTRMLRARQLDDRMTDRALESIERNTRLQMQLIEDLLDISHILQGKLKLNISMVNLISVVETVLESMKLAAASKSIDLKVQLPALVDSSNDLTKQPAAIAAICVLGDPARLQQILWNLVSNAVKFTPKGGQVTVELATVPERVATQRDQASEPFSDSTGENNTIEITITDTGKGIEAEFLPLIFDYFRQADSTITRQFGGLGLGLTIVRHLVELHGGRIEADSPGLDQGATFRVYLPLVPTFDRSKAVQVMPSIISATIAEQLRHLRVLLVDDDVDMRDYVEYVLQTAGAQVALAGSAGEALAKLPRFQPHVLISDIGLPNIDGYRLLRQIRTLMPELGGQVPAIALTAYAGEYNQQQVLAAGFQQHLTKPVEPETLVEVVSQLAKPNLA